MNTDALDTYRFASFEKLERAFLAGELSEADARCLLARKDYAVQQIGWALKDWKATRRFLAEGGR